MVRSYLPEDDGALLRLWNTAGIRMGYAPLTQEKFRRLLPDHPDFSAAYTFLLEQEGAVAGFISGCAGEHLPGGAARGYISCLILARDADTPENTALLLGTLEDAFRKNGHTQCMASFFNPVRLPWVMP